MGEEITKTDIQSIVNDIFSDREEADARKKTEEELKRAADTIAGLTTSLEEQNGVSEELEGKLAEANDKFSDLESKLEAAEKDLEDVKATLSTTEEDLDKMKKDKVAEERMTALTEAKILHSDVNAQREKVLAMTDEDFASYKKDLEDVRKAVEQELAKTPPKEVEPPPPEKDDAGEGDAGEGDDTASDDAGEGNADDAAPIDTPSTPPANVAPGAAIAAALNFEVAATPDMLAKYGELGKAMADGFKKDTEK